MKKIIAILVCMIVIAPAWSNDNSQSDSNLIEDADITVSVTAMRSHQPNNQIPASITVITAEQLRHRTIQEALRLYAGIDMRSFSGTSAVSQPSVRGFTETGHGRVLILFDGIRLNNPDMSPLNWLTIPGAGEIERIEVVRGGASSLYGDHAVAAVVNIIPRKPEEGVSVSAGVIGGSNSYLEKSFTLSGANDLLSFSISAIDSRTDGWRDRTGTENTGASVSISSSFAERGSASLFLSAGSQMYEMPGGLTKEDFKDNPRQAIHKDDKAEIRFLFMQAQGKWEFTERLSLSLTAGYNSKNTNTDMTSWGTFTDTNLDSITAGISFTGEFPLLLREVRMTTGIDFIRNDLDAKRYFDVNREIKAPGGGKVNKTNFAFFSRGELPVTERLFFSASGRFDYALYSCNLDTINENKRYSIFSYGAGLNFMLSDNGKVYVRYDRVFRFPFLDELIIYSGFLDDAINKDLKPEKGHSFDLGVEYRFGKRAVLGVNLFLLLMDGEIAWNNQLEQNKNLSKTIRYGVESFISFTPVKNFSLRGTYNFTIAKFRDGENKGNQIPIVPVHRFTVVPELSFFNMLRIYSEISYSASFFRGGDESNTQDKIDGYLLYNMGIVLNIPAGKSLITIFGKVRNIANKKYAEYVWGNFYYPGSGREVLVGVSFSL